MSRRTLRLLARLALAGALFAQVALAIAACERASASHVQAILAASGAGGEDCHHEERNAAAGLCVAHCLTEAQTLDKPSAQLPSPAAAAVVTTFLLPAPAAAPPAVPAPALAALGPPRRILFRSLLI